MVLHMPHSLSNEVITSELLGHMILTNSEELVQLWHFLAMCFLDRFLPALLTILAEVVPPAKNGGTA